MVSENGEGEPASGWVVESYHRLVGAGSQVDSFDPILTGNLNIEHGTFPLSNTVLNGVPSLTQNTGTANFGYTQAFPTGTSLQVFFQNNRVTTNSIFTTLVPQLNSGFRVELRQHLLSGFGLGPNMRFIRIARNNREISDIAFRNQVIATVSQIANIYWDLVNAYEDERVKQRALDLANKTLSKFPFRLPKNLALYMRMTSIVEGIYQHHHVNLQFVKVLSQILEQEGLIRDAYIEEVKDSIKRFAKGIEQSVELAPMLKLYLDTQQIYGNKRETSYNFLAASVFASALFLGSALVLPHTPAIAYGGFIASTAAFGIALAAILKKR